MRAGREKVIKRGKKAGAMIDGHPNFHRRCALEAWHIRSQDSLMNRDAGPLPQVYNPMIRPQNSTR